MRFQCGTVKALSAPSPMILTDIDRGGAIQFRLLVIASDGLPAKARPSLSQPLRRYPSYQQFVKQWSGRGVHLLKIRPGVVEFSGGPRGDLKTWGRQEGVAIYSDDREGSGGG